MKKILLTLLVGMFLISIASAQFYYKQSAELDLKVPCFNNDTICSDAAVCNISILYPNSSFLIDDQTMTNLQNGYHNYTLNESQTSVPGEYPVNIYCDDVGEKGYSTFTFIINRAGHSLTTGEAILLFLSVFIVLMLAIFLIMPALKTENIYLKIIFASLSCLMLLISVLATMAIMDQILGVYPALIEGFSAFWLVIKVMASLAVLGLVLFLGWVSLQLWLIKRGFKD